VQEFSGKKYIQITVSVVAQIEDNAASHTRESSGWQLAQGWSLELLSARVERALSLISDRLHTALLLIQSKLLLELVDPRIKR
jgi:hypothetical protein